MVAQGQKRGEGRKQVRGTRPRSSTMGVLTRKQTKRLLLPVCTREGDVLVSTRAAGAAGAAGADVFCVRKAVVESLLREVDTMVFEFTLPGEPAGPDAVGSVGPVVFGVQRADLEASIGPDTEKTTNSMYKAARYIQNKLDIDSDLESIRRSLRELCTADDTTKDTALEEAALRLSDRLQMHALHTNTGTRLEEDIKQDKVAMAATTYHEGARPVGEGADADPEVEAVRKMLKDGNALFNQISTFEVQQALAIM